MDYLKALLLRDSNLHLIGQREPEYNLVVDDIIILPTNKAIAMEFAKRYVDNIDQIESLMQFEGVDVDVYALFFKRIIPVTFALKYCPISDIPGAVIT